MQCRLSIPYWRSGSQFYVLFDVMSFRQCPFDLVYCTFDTRPFWHNVLLTQWYSDIFFSEVFFLQSALPTQSPFSTGSVFATECPFGIVYFRDSVRSTSVFRYSVVWRSVVRWSFGWSSNTFAVRSWAHEDMCMRHVPKDTSKDTCFWRRNNGNVKNSRVWPSWTLAKRAGGYVH